MSDITRYIMKRYPEKTLQIRRLVLRDSGFRTICEDYGKCVEAMEYFDHSQDPRAKARADEYRTLIQDLEEEISQALVALKPRWLD